MCAVREEGSCSRELSCISGHKCCICYLGDRNITGCYCNVEERARQCVPENDAEAQEHEI